MDVIVWLVDAKGEREAGSSVFDAGEQLVYGIEVEQLGPETDENGWTVPSGKILARRSMIVLPLKEPAAAA